jgi:chromosome segregation ATPase
MVVRSHSLPEIDDINYQIAYYKHDLTGEQIVMQKEPEMRRLLEDAKNSNDVWDEIIGLEKEIESMWKQTWEYEEEYQRLIWIKYLTEEEVQYFGLSKTKIDGLILVSYPDEYNLRSRLDNAEEEMRQVEGKIKKKREELYTLYERGKNGEEVVDDIITLRSEIAELQKQYNNNRSTCFEIKVMFDTAFIVI